MGLRTHRLGSSPTEPYTLEVSSQVAAASPLLAHLAAKLPKLQVLAKKSWFITDDFEAYFLYKGRLFVMETPFVNIWISLLGQPADEPLFSEVEAEVQKYGFRPPLRALVASLQYLFLPSNPPEAVLRAHNVVLKKSGDASADNAL